LIPPGARCLVSEDTAHSYETTRAALDGSPQFVSIGSFFVVEDGCVASRRCASAGAGRAGACPRSPIGSQGSRPSV